MTSADFQSEPGRGPVVLTAPAVDLSVCRGLKGAPTVLSHAGEKSTLRLAGDGARHVADSEIAFTATPLPGNRLQVDAELRHGDNLLGSSRVITQDGEPALIEVA